MGQEGRAFFKQTPVLDAPLNQFVKHKSTPSKSKVRIIPEHPMSVEDSYLYSFNNSEVGTFSLGELGGLEVGTGNAYRRNLDDIVHIHTVARYVYKNGVLYKQ
jgi:hypothetical protein